MSLYNPSPTLWDITKHLARKVAEWWHLPPIPDELTDEDLRAAMVSLWKWEQNNPPPNQPYLIRELSDGNYEYVTEPSQLVDDEERNAWERMCRMNASWQQPSGTDPLTKPA